MPIIFSTSSLALPATLARFTGLDILKKAAVALVPGGNACPGQLLCIVYFGKFIFYAIIYTCKFIPITLKKHHR